MTAPIKTLDLPCELLLPVGGSFFHQPIGEYSQGQWSPIPRAGGIRQKLWMATVNPAPFMKGKRGDRRFEFEAFIERLDGTSTAFRLWDPWRGLPRGMGAGIWSAHDGQGQKSLGKYLIDSTYHIDGHYAIDGGSTLAYVNEDAPRYSDSVVLGGLVPDALVFKVGDDFELGGNLYRVLDDALSDSAGNARVIFSWKLWKPALAGDRVNLHRPCSRFVLTDANQGVIQRALSGGEVSFQCIEYPVTE